MLTKMLKILMEFYFHKIMVAAAEQGMIDAAERLRILQAFAESRNRFREARFLMYFRISVMSDVGQISNILQGFLDLIDGTNLDIEKAQTLVDLGESHMRSDDPKIAKRSEENFQRAREIFENAGHAYGALDVDNIQLSNAHDLAEGELFLKKQQLVARYFQVHCYRRAFDARYLPCHLRLASEVTTRRSVGALTYSSRR